MTLPLNGAKASEFPTVIEQPMHAYSSRCMRTAAGCMHTAAGSGIQQQADALRTSAACMHTAADARM